MSTRDTLNSNNSLFFYKLVLLLLACVAFAVLVGPQRAEAVNNNITGLPNDPVLDAMQSWDQLTTSTTGTSGNHCADIMNNAQLAWLSSFGNSTTRTATIPSTATSLGLQINTVGAFCDSIINSSGIITDGRLKNTRWHFLGATATIQHNGVGTRFPTGTVSGLVGQTLEVGYDHPLFYNDRYTQISARGLVVNGLGGLPPGNHILRVSVTYKPINRFVEGTTESFRCVLGRQIVGSLNDHGICGQAVESHAIIINVASPPAERFDLYPSRNISLGDSRVDFGVRNDGAGQSRLGDNQGVMVVRRVWVNGTSVYAPSTRHIINGGGTWSDSYNLNVSPGDVVCAFISVRPSSGVTGEGSWPDPPVRSEGGLDTGCLTVARNPYHKVFGGDVSVGAGIGSTSCSKDDSTRILGWHDLSGRKGAGTQLAAFAIGAIEEFATAQQVNNANQRGLTFANTDPSLGYGGGLGAEHIACMPRYWSPPATPDINAPNLNLDILALGEHYRDGDLNITAAQPIGLGRRLTVYVNGNVYINSDIVYSTGDYSSGVSSIPSLRIIARGNIYVAPDVGSLSGLFVAVERSTGDGGYFYTCGEGGAPLQAELVAGLCNKQLKVTGAVVAKTIKFLRTSSSLSNAPDNENYNSSTEAAERFYYPPEMWLTSDFGSGGSQDSYYSLPPVL